MPKSAALGSLRSCSQTAQSLRLYDSLIQVNRAGHDAAALFWLSCYLKQPNGLQKDGSIQCSALSFTRFQVDLESHFGYDAEKDVIWWENKTPGLQTSQPECQAQATNSNDVNELAHLFAVQSHNSWVTAIMTMQAINFPGRAPTASSIKSTSAGPVFPASLASASLTAAKFIIYRNEQDGFMEEDRDFIDTTTGSDDTTTDSDEAPDTESLKEEVSVGESSS